MPGLQAGLEHSQMFIHDFTESGILMMKKRILWDLVVWQTDGRGIQNADSCCRAKSMRGPARSSSAPRQTEHTGSKTRLLSINRAGKPPAARNRSGSHGEAGVLRSQRRDSQRISGVKDGEEFIQNPPQQQSYHFAIRARLMTCREHTIISPKTRSPSINRACYDTNRQNN